MKKENSLMPLLFLLAILLIVGAAILYSSNPQIQKVSVPSKVYSPVNTAMEQLKEQEILDLPSTLTKGPSGVQKGQEEPQAELFDEPPADILVAQEIPQHPNNRFAVPSLDESSTPRFQPRSENNFSVDTPSSPIGAYSPVDSLGGQTPDNLSLTHSTQDASQSVPSSRQQAAQLAGRAGVSQDGDDILQSFDPLAPYMTSLPKEQLETLNKQLQTLPGSIEAALLRALLPKSKKDMNIEKYLSRNNTSGAVGENAGGESGQKSGPTAILEKQISRQTSGIVNSMRKTFGDKAAKEASKQMESYKNEIMNLLGQKHLTKEQIQQKARAISKKHNKKLQELGQKSALERFQEEREASDNALQSRFAKAYGNEIAGTLGNIMATYREKELELAQQNLPSDEYVGKWLEIQREKNKEMKETLLKNGQSLGPWAEIENQTTQEHIQNMKDDQVYIISQEQKKEMANDREIKRQEQRSMAQQMYGEAGAKRVDEIFNEYNDKVNQIVNTPDLSEKEAATLLEQARRETNQKLHQFQQEPEMRAQLVNNQVNAGIENMLKDPAFADATAEQRQAFETYARPVLQDMFTRIGDVDADTKLSEQQKKQKKQAIMEEAQRKLTGPQ